MRKNFRKLVSTVLAVSLVGAMTLVTGCGKKEAADAPEADAADATEETESEAAEAANDNGELREVTVILDYLPNTNHTGMYIADENGYYAEEGLKVNIIEPTDGTAATLIAQNKGDFGITYQEDITFGHLSEDPIPVKAIAQIIPHNPSGIAVLADSGIESPKDFEGKTFAGWGGAGEQEMLHAFMDAYDGDFSKLNMIISDGAGFESLGKGVDMLWLYEAWDCVAAELAGVDLNLLMCKDMDDRLDYYTTMIVAHDDTINNDPEMVAAFLRATEKGYMDAIADPDAAAELMAKYCPDTDIEMLKKSQNILAERFMEGIDTWGKMEDETWSNYMDFLEEYGVVTEPVDVKEMYTNQFFE
ncbi:MAG: ABC transporter substrate-binding protein [Lachnospiraceae bacterium]|nr:ABC transporter substrate-binding protein [Candidatus Equihabitans merdae]